ncbi:FeoA family protein [Paucidesulfovibrio longus]|uniref:FeoA family protein n=1 Tax=Paucidesulfovibrio longus TaxID=889 RepID=UPI0003B442D6|nr:FeoA domain-containing protein [Paucidesulfovibrio longus]
MKNQPLCRFPQGSLVRVEDLASCRGARSRLYALGLTPGTELEVISTSGGPCRLRVRGSDLIIGHGLANKIIVCPVDPCASECRIEDDPS